MYNTLTEVGLLIHFVIHCSWNVKYDRASFRPRISRRWWMLKVCFILFPDVNHKPHFLWYFIVVLNLCMSSPLNFVYYMSRNQLNQKHKLMIEIPRYVIYSITHPHTKAFGQEVWNATQTLFIPDAKYSMVVEILGKKCECNTNPLHTWW